MLYQIVYTSEAASQAGFSTLTLAHILGAAERNNRRDQITGMLIVHQGRVLQVLEGGRVDLDRLMPRLLADPRHTGVRILSDSRITTRQWAEPMALCDAAGTLLERMGMNTLARVTADEAQVILTHKAAA